jgi:hypothetical protein
LVTVIFARYDNAIARTADSTECIRRPSTANVSPRIVTHTPSASPSAVRSWATEGAMRTLAPGTAADAILILSVSLTLARGFGWMRGGVYTEQPQRIESMLVAPSRIVIVEENNARRAPFVTAGRMPAENARFCCESFRRRR